LLDNEAFRTHAIINLVGNVLVFVPLGYFLPKIWKGFRLLFVTILTVAMLMIVVEFLQYATGLGSCDVDDLILNVAGTLIGYLIWLIKKR
jgi:glycopeptide antibiotics resistance protein